MKVMSVKSPQKIKNCFSKPNFNLHVTVIFSDSSGTVTAISAEIMSKIVFNSNDMVNDLIDKGVIPRKSLILQPPNISEEFYLPFILGYFDGDGSISQGSNNEFYINIVGTKEILEWINNILNISSKLEQRKETTKNNYYIRCGGYQKPYNIMKQLYNSVSVHLDRKYNIYKNLETVVLNGNIK